MHTRNRRGGGGGNPSILGKKAFILRKEKK